MSRSDPDQFTVFQTSSAGILRGTTAPDSRALFTQPALQRIIRAPTRNRSAATPASRWRPGAAFDLYLPEGGGVMIFAVPAPHRGGCERRQ